MFDYNGASCRFHFSFTGILSSAKVESHFLRMLAAFAQILVKIIRLYYS